MSDVTQILKNIKLGDQQAASELLPLVYGELRKLAEARMSSERVDHTLQPTALVHEAFLRLVGGQQQLWESRGHFFSAAAESMRRILIDHARAKKSSKRAAPSESSALPKREDSILDDPERLLELNEALCKLEREDAQIAELIRLRLFAGLTLKDAASVIGISKSTAHDWWKYAVNWFRVELQDA